MAKILTLISSMGGVGKTHFAVNLAYRLTTLGHRTCLFNADSDSSRIYDLAGAHPNKHLSDFIKRHHPLNHVIQRCPTGIDLLPGIPGVEDVPGLEANDWDRFVRSFQELDPYDYIILDTFPGLSRNVVAFSKASSAVILVLTPESTVLAKTHLFLKVLAGNGFSGSVSVLINKCSGAKRARAVFSKLKDAVVENLPLDIQPLGFIFPDPHVGKAGEAKKIFIDRYSETIAAKCLNHLAHHIVDKKIDEMSFADFWPHFLKEMKRPFQLMVNRPIHDLKAQHIKDGDTGLEPIDSISKPLSPQSDKIGGDPVESINNRLNQLLEQIGTLSQEIQEMKQLVQNRGASMADPVLNAEDSRGSMFRIPLDFEDYVKRRNRLKI